MSWLRKVVLLMAIAVMPLQGMATTLSVLACLNGEDAHAAHHSGYGYAGYDHVAQHASGDDDAGSSHADHLCCQHLVSALPLASVVPAPADFSKRAHNPLPLHNLYLPEQPQRPPLV